ncbi:hypothetical protein GCM10023329_45440 [Streptomyces sanyensis]|uniref:Uncharacterized protein n=1 Tax=Streptomyces sanyensis TaxID=568869 RepID=A0ABP9B1X9_9ACTN
MGRAQLLRRPLTRTGAPRRGTRPPAARTRAAGGAPLPLRPDAGARQGPQDAGAPKAAPAAEETPAARVRPVGTRSTRPMPRLPTRRVRRARVPETTEDTAGSTAGTDTPGAPASPAPPDALPVHLPLADRTAPSAAPAGTGTRRGCPLRRRPRPRPGRPGPDVPHRVTPP